MKIDNFSFWNISINRKTKMKCFEFHSKIVFGRLKSDRWKHKNELCVVFQKHSSSSVNSTIHFHMRNRTFFLNSRKEKFSYWSVFPSNSLRRTVISKSHRLVNYQSKHYLKKSGTKPTALGGAKFFWIKKCFKTFSNVR